MGDGTAGNLELRLRQISPETEHSLVFRFDSPIGEFDWIFEPGSMAEFLALLLGGSLRSGGAVSIPHAAVSASPKDKVGAAELCVSLGPVDLISTLDAGALDALAAGLARIRAGSGKP